MQRDIEQLNGAQGYVMASVTSGLDGLYQKAIDRMEDCGVDTSLRSERTVQNALALHSVCTQKIIHLSK